MFGSGRKKPSAERTNRRDDPFTALYSKHSKPSTPSTTTGSGSSRSAVRQHRAFLPSSLRRSAQPTVELVTPAPDVELTRASEIVRPVLGMTGELASLQSLRQTQAEHQPAPSDPAASVRSLAASDSDSDGYQDERDIPFRTNAVEIATQDDKGELAFLAHHEPWLGELERSRLILPQLAGRLQPTTHTSVLPDRLLAPPEMPSQVYDELEAICDFNQAARERPGGAMGEFAGEHLRRIVRQLLAEIDVDEAAGWDGVVYDLAVGAVGSVRPDVRHGDNMDLRRYVRIKRIPGGVPGDSQYIAGLVFTKSLAHRRMPRIYSSPRIMLLALPLEHAAPSRYVSFDAELRVQQGFAEKLVQRIVGAGPDVVLAEKPVPRNILEALMRNRVAVVAGVKRSVLRAIARCTGAEIVTSMDKFSGRPRIGTCREMVAQTYQHPSLPQVRKSFVFLDGCEPSRGGTIVLRGESFERLADIKQVVDLAVCFAYSLHLETALLVDEFALAVPGQYNVVSSDPGNSLAAAALAEYNVVLSSSPSVRIPPPHVLERMRDGERALSELTERFRELSAGGPSDDAVHAATGVAFLVSRQQSAASTSRMRQQYASEMALHEGVVREGEHFLDANPQAVSLWDYQSIVVSYMVTCRRHDHLVCAGPQPHAISFYGRTDVTLGQYLEEMCFDLNYDCPGSSRTCTHPMYEHRRSYIHHNGRIDVTMDEHPSPIERLSDIILMWGSCRICHSRTPVSKMSDEAWRYSFGKYLETTFYNACLLPRASICGHDVHHDYVRCFALRHMVVRFEYAPLALWRMAVPTIPLFFDVEVSIRLKEREAAELRTRLDAYYASLRGCLEAFPMDMVYDDRLDECKAIIEGLRDRAHTEHVYFRQSLEQTIRNSHPADTLVVVVVYEQLQTKVVEWNLQFSDLAQVFIQLDARSAAVKRTGSNEGQVPETVDEMHQDAESPQFAMPVLGESPVEESHMAGPYTVSRLHRRLSMQMMRRERERQERQIERARRNLVEAAGFGRTRAPRSALKNALQKPEPERAHADEIARTPAEFPELKDQKAKPKEALKETQKEPQKEPPSRIPAYRAPPAARAANVRPLSSFGRPPPANNSSIPRAPRARPTSPPGSTADSSKPNVFLRLARRLNRAKDVQPAPALGTMPRKMNLLLPAAAQYMQHPRRPAMPQVQVFRARPTDAPMRRHSHVEDDFVILDHDAADEQPARRRAATVARPPLNGRYGNVQPLRQPEPPARASSIIPSITRRLGLGFPFGQRPTDNRSTASMDIGRSERAPIPEAFEAVHVSSSSSSISIDSSSDSDSAIDDHLDRRRLSYRSTHSANPLASPQVDLIMSSPVPAKRRPTSPDSDGNLSLLDTDLRHVLESNRRRISTHQHHDSSTDEDDTHQPDLHFGESDAGSDSENITAMTEQDAENAAAYLESVVRASGTQQPPPLPKVQTSALAADQGSIDTSAVPVPQENLTTIWKTISGLISAPGNQQLFQIGLDLKYPLESTEHVIAGSPIIVRESEPSSIIAFTLMASEYRTELHKVLEPAAPPTATPDGNSPGSPSSPPSVRSPRNEFARATPAEHAQELIEYAMLHAPLSHLKLQFTAGRTLFKCKVMFAPQFDGLRRCSGCEDSYIESLARCATYDAQGGKSGSAFLETRDKRFIIKQVPKAEMDAFEKLAPFYFEHMYRTYRDVMHTLLAKIFGVCRISYRNAATGKSMKMNVVIMENLFYQRTCSRVFDLKGSERNRMVDETEGASVFQDQNLLRLIRENPICIRQLTKQHLHDAIWNDTLFLSKMNVMDYSLLVGFDESSNQLVVGIVDFIRTFTWDKKLESWVKESGILGGGGGKGPTIVSPKQYKNRFREAMERYFLMAPDKFFVLPAEDED